VAEVRLGIVVGEAEDDEEALPEFVRFLDGVFEGVVMFGADGGLHPVKDMFAAANFIVVESLYAFRLNLARRQALSFLTGSLPGSIAFLRRGFERRNTFEAAVLAHGGFASSLRASGNTISSGASMEAWIHLASSTVAARRGRSSLRISASLAHFSLSRLFCPR